MLEIRNHKLVFSFPELHANAVCSISFKRTLRIPDDNRQHPLPPGLGNFPIEHVEDHASRLPARWAEHGGVLLPMYQAEALWINFECADPQVPGDPEYPFAVKIAAGKINAVTGEGWKNALARKPQDYVVLPLQPWLDGFCVSKGVVRQFVAMPLGNGYTAEEQLTGAAEHGGLQIIVYPIKREIYEAMVAESRAAARRSVECRTEGMMYSNCADYDMGLAPGGLMSQEIYKDDQGYGSWDQTISSRSFVHILNSQQWSAATGRPAMRRPPSAEDYTAAGLPWFEYYAEDAVAVQGSKKLQGLDSLAAAQTKQGIYQPPTTKLAPMPHVVKLAPGTKKVEDGSW